eukprot:6125082-Alexandrium_andersonii.AAC.1
MVGGEADEQSRAAACLHQAEADAPRGQGSSVQGRVTLPGGCASASRGAVPGRGARTPGRWRDQA